MKSILVPIEDTPGVETQLTTALLAAAPFGGHIDGVAPRSIVDVYFYGDGLSPVALDQWQQEDEERVQRAQTAFRAFVDRSGLAWGDPMQPSGAVTADWLTEVASGHDAIGELARLYDVTVLPRPSSQAAIPGSTLLETVLFESGHPILMAPPEIPKALGKVILIAWNGSTESARAITFAQPFLTRAERVLVLQVEGGGVAGPDVGDVERALRRGGIPVEAVNVPQTGRSVGETILAEAGKISADLVVKGAYTQSRFRQMIFGGATSHILSESEIPVLMAH